MPIKKPLVISQAIEEESYHYLKANFPEYL